MEKPFIEIEAKNFIMHPQEAQPIDGYEFPVNDDGIKFPYCCETHSELYKSAREYLNKFPDCCDAHKEFATKPFFNRALYDGVAERLVNQCSYTEFMINERINNEDWYEDITDYIDYNIRCFGHPPVAANHYINYIEIRIKDKDLIADKLKQERILEYFSTAYSPVDKAKKNKRENTDLNVLYELYQKWLKIFPFEISFLSHLKPKFERMLPFVRGKGKTNRYTGLTAFKAHTKSSLIEFLLNITNALLTQINTSVLYQNGILKEPERIKLEIIVSERKLKLDKGYVNKSKTEEQRYRKILKEWFADEKTFIDEVTPLLKALPALLPQPEQPVQKDESKTLALIKQHIEDIDNEGWQYSFHNENDYNAFTLLLTAYFEQREYSLPAEVIKLKRNSKTKFAKALGEILRELGNKDKLKEETGYFDIIRKLNHFENDSDIYKAITR